MAEQAEETPEICHSPENVCVSNTFSQFHTPMSQRRIMKNVIVLSMGFFFLFSAYLSLEVLQSTVNKHDGLGTANLAIIYVSVIVSCMFVPPFMIAKLGCKWTIIASMACYFLYMAANIHAVPWLIYPAAVITGFAAAPLWSAKCAYITETSSWYAKITKETHTAVLSKFFGIFFLFFQLASVWGNLIASTVLATAPQNLSEQQVLTCGAHFCPHFQDNNTNLDRPTDRKIYTMIGSYIGCGIIAILIIVILLDKINLGISRETEEVTSHKKSGQSQRLLMETLRFWWKSTNLKLIIPLTIFIGIEQGFLSSEITKSFIGCSIGLWNVGYVLMCVGICNSLFAFIFGRLVSYVGRIALFVLGAAISLSVLISMLFWQPTSDSYIVLYIFGGGWGVADAIWQAQINALYGQLFKDDCEAAFANYNLWESLGYAVTFASSNYLCTDIKIYGCIAALAAGMSGYACMELRQRRRSLENRVSEQSGCELALKCTDAD